ncbi:LysR substrate-binding domain-containing protein [Agromyces sp. H3Y2-19a]|jgi:DNA-binding transcriptional LysR family regulator|uniref:LysR substrate-binding domain-containing protein n=1 Tax=Agromyces TaxID=33877 RepID=UPI001E5CF585|nr:MULTISPECIES: LysR substrate-binding domain-containing protein [Agromyces]MCD5344877.1 LysR substrate-binding domain-containing protein [Agromyces sp. S2-1-8]MDF0513940.1 LysR substrate-binding domain-containing protein [Agromyces chromiiresistens]
MARLGRSDLTLVQLRYFVAAATKRSMTEASVDLHVAQSAVSTAIAQLERTLGVQLFVRQRSKGLALTEAGEQLLRDAHSLLAQVDEMADAVRGHHHDVRGTLRLACFVTLAPFVLPTLISRVEAEHPRLRIEVFEADADGTVAMLLNGSVEAAIAYDFGQLHDLSFDHLFSAPPHVILPADHPLAASERIELSALAGQDLVLLDMPHSREYFLGMLAAAGVEPQIRYSSRSYETVRSLVARGQGYSILNQVPRSPQTYDGGELRAVAIADDVAPLDVCLVRVAGVRPTARARVVATLARELFGAPRG